MSCFKKCTIQDRVEGGVDSKLHRRQVIFDVVVVLIVTLSQHASDSMVDPFAYGISSWIVASRFDLFNAKISVEFINNTLHEFLCIV